MAEVLVSFTVPTRSPTGDLYWPRALGRRADDGLWQGWIEFTRAGDDVVVCTARESTQPNRADLMYWAQGLTATYLEGALDRALKPAPTAVPQRDDTPAFVNSAPRRAVNSPRAISRRVVLDPFSTYAEGEELLSNQLRALSHDHLQSIVDAYGFATADEAAWVRSAPDNALVQRIVERVRDRFATATETAPAAEGDRQNATEADQTA